MSGPKRADVIAELSVANATAHTAAAVVSSTESKVLNTLLTELDELGESHDVLSGCDGMVRRCRSDVSALNKLKSSLESVRALSADAEVAAQKARSLVKAAESAHRECIAEYEAASAEYSRSRSALLEGGQHYLSEELASAREATRRYKLAAEYAENAQKIRAEARSAIAEALRLGRNQQSAARGSLDRVEAALSESDALSEAERDANAILDGARRSATLSVKAAGAAIAGVPAECAERFFSGRRQRLLEMLAQAEAALKQGAASESQRDADLVRERAAQLAAEVDSATAALARERGEAEAAHEQLKATVGASDAKLIAEWADDPAAHDAAQAGVSEIGRLIANERFAEAGLLSSQLIERLREATVTAANTRAADERRTSIGDAIMDALEEMAFDVSFEPGTKTSPLKIAGQVPADSGEGDFVLELPLEGEVDFEVTDSNTDGSPCSNAVARLRARLAARGVEFEVTDWGHGADPDLASPRTVTRTKGIEKSATRTRNH